MQKLSPRFQLSGHNSHFSGPYPTFADYISATQAMIAKACADLGAEYAQKCIDNNSPFELKPAQFGLNNKPRKGVLLVHGLTNSPFIMRDLAEHFYQQGYLVRAILLPGHGTRPGDLLEVQAEDWLAAAEYGVASFEGEVDELYLVGLSLGGLLCLHEALAYKPCAGLVLFAPALQVKSPFAEIASYHSWFSWVSPRAAWLALADNGNPSKYESLPFNAIAQTLKLTKKVAQLTKTQILQPNLFIILTDDDETISTQAALDYFSKQSNPKNHLLLYSKEFKKFDDPRIHLRSSVFPKEGIIDFSHHCLQVSPDNPVYGRNGSYVDMLHYQFQPRLKPGANSNKPLVKGAATFANIRHHYMQRLSYNPDFKAMIAEIDEFL